jgi:hypothetical protein
LLKDRDRRLGEERVFAHSPLLAEQLKGVDLGERAEGALLASAIIAGVTAGAAPVPLRR